MKFSDIFKKSFLEGYALSELSTTKIVTVLIITSILAIYVFFCYRFITKRTFYSKGFNVSLTALSIITAGIILTIQSSVVVSLGMVGALSIVRFRTAIKEPMDLVFLFWAISIGIICGAGLFEIAIITSVFATVIIVVLDKTPISKAPKLLVINLNENGKIDDCLNIIKKYTKNYSEKSCKTNGLQTDYIYELRINKNVEFVNELRSVTGVISISLLSHDGEVTF